MLRINVLSIIIVNYNTEKLLKDCIESIYSETIKTNFEIIVVDNNSKDNSCEMVGSNFPEVVLIKSPENSGFASANNKGIEKALGNVILLLNSDTVIYKNGIDKAYEYLVKSSDIDVLGPMIYNIDETDNHIIENSYGSFVSIFSIVKNKFFFIKEDYSKSKYVNWITGAFFLIKKSVIDNVGMMDGSIFLYYEDVEWCYRVNRAGLKIFYYAEPCVIHLKGMSTKNINRRLLRWKSIEYVLRKNMSFGNFFTWCFYKLVLSVYRKEKK